MDSKIAIQRYWSPILMQSTLCKGKDLKQLFFVWLIVAFNTVERHVMLKYIWKVYFSVCSSDMMCWNIISGEIIITYEIRLNDFLFQGEKYDHNRKSGSKCCDVTMISEVTMSLPRIITFHYHLEAKIIDLWYMINRVLPYMLFHIVST